MRWRCGRRWRGGTTLSSSELYRRHPTLDQLLMGEYSMRKVYREAPNLNQLLMGEYSMRKVYQEAPNLNQLLMGELRDSLALTHR